MRFLRHIKRWCTVTYHRPAINPIHSVKHQFASARITNIDGMVQNPIGALLVGEKLSVVPRPLEASVTLQNDLMLIFKHSPSLLIKIGTEKRSRTSDH